MKKLIPVGFVAFLAFCMILSCSKEKSYETGAGGTPATGKIVKDSAGNCLPATVHGTYYSGKTISGDTTYVEIQVNVTKTGPYKITTDSQNNMIFSDSSYFAATGTQTIKLKAAGKPIIAGTFDFTVVFDTSYCSFTIPVLDGAATGNTDDNSVSNANDTAWHFKDGGTTYQGSVDSMYVKQAYPGTDSAATILYLRGYTASFDTSFQLGAVLPSGVLKQDTVYTSTSGTLVALGGQSGYIYEADGYQSTGATIGIETYNASTGVVIGFFTATALHNGTLTPISGRFSGKLTQ